MMWEKAVEILNPYEALKNAASNSKKGKTMRLKTYILLRLLTFLAAVGCATVYAVIWRVVGLPIGLWAMIACALLGVLSTWGLLWWMKRARNALAQERINRIVQKKLDELLCGSILAKYTGAEQGWGPCTGGVKTPPYMGAVPDGVPARRAGVVAPYGAMSGVSTRDVEDAVPYREEDEM